MSPYDRLVKLGRECDRILMGIVTKRAYMTSNDPEILQAYRELAAAAEEYNQLLEEDGIENYPQPMFGWTCFHCGMRFYDGDKAREHFGETPDGKTVCTA